MSKHKYTLGLGCAAGAAGGCVSALLGRPGTAAILFAAGLLCAGVLCILLLCRLRASEAERARLASTLDEVRSADAEALERTISEYRSKAESFRSVLSHDLRMPISIVQGYAELLHGGVVTDGAARDEYLGKILERTRYMSDVLTKQLVEARSGEQTVAVCTRLDLVALARQIAADMQKAAGCRGVSIQVISAQPQLFVRGDRYQLNKVFFNLLENSLKYMGREGIVTIRLTRGDGVADIMIKDDGLGLDPGETLHICERSFQGSNRAGGHGHGLYLVKWAVEAQGGTIRVESALGQGMGTFITLPLAGEAAPVSV